MLLISRLVPGEILERYLPLPTTPHRKQQLCCRLVAGISPRPVIALMLVYDVHGNTFALLSETGIVATKSSPGNHLKLNEAI